MPSFTIYTRDNRVSAPASSIIANMIYSSMPPSKRAPAQAPMTAETHTGTTTSWLPMTTSPPIDRRCTDHLYSPDGADHTLIAFDPRLEVAANITCLPREAAEWYTQKQLPFGATAGTLTSLGPMVCPNAYTMASTSKKDDTSTMIFCCPSEYGFASSAGPGEPYGCTSQQTQRVTVHYPGATKPVRTLAAGSFSRARNVAGVAVNGWILEPSPRQTPARPSEAFAGDTWARKHFGMSTAEVLGILIAISAVVLLVPFVTWFLVKRKRGVRKARSDEQGTSATGNNTKDSSTSAEQVNVNPSQDVELCDLDKSGSRIPSTTETVVHHVEHSWRKHEGSSSSEEDTIP